MAVKTEKVFNSFTKGLVTEASPLTFPENASLDEQNFVLNRDGSRSRRLGVDYEDLYAKTATGFTATQLASSKQSFHKWESPGGDTTVSIGVVRINNKLWFMDMLTANPSDNLLNSGNPITISGLSNANIETTALNNKLVVVSDDLDDPVVLTYNPSTEAVSQSTVDIKIRDIYGVNDGLAVDTRPSTLSATHKYNLRNQGWNKNIVTVPKTGDHDGDAATPNITSSDALVATRIATGGYPSNSDTWTLGKNTNATSGDYEKYDASIITRNSTSKFQVAKGSFVIDAFNRGTSRMAESDVNSGLPLDQEQGSITTVASYAQRVFYSGVSSSVTGGDARSPNYSGYIFFTKVIQSDDDFGKCYQDADPTDPAINDLIDSDGGTIQIPEITKIVKIAASQASLLVFCENGVWEVYGDTGGFFATSFQVSKISTNGVLNPQSVVNVNGNFIYWSKAGIYMLTPEAASGRFSAQSLSLTTIQTLFLGIPDIGKNNCRGFYDEKENRVRWLYNDSDDYSSTNYINKYTKELVLDLTLEAFYLNNISDLASNSPYIADYIEVPGYAVTTSDTAIEAGTDEVIVTSGDTVVVSQPLVVNRSSLFSFLVISGTSFTVGKYNSTRFLDWYSEDNTGVNFTSYLLGGYELFKDVMREKQSPYIFFYFKKTEDGFEAINGELFPTKQSSCLFQAQWNWTNSVNSNKWTRPIQAYRLLRFYTPTGVADDFDTGEEVIVTKNKIRGSGKALSIKLESEEGKDMRVLGWALPATATDVV